MRWLPIASIGYINRINMKRIIMLLLVSQVLVSANAQSLAKGKAQLNVGVGLSGWGVPVYGGFDYGIARDFTLGGELSYRSYREGDKDDRYRHSIFGISANVNYHFNHVLNMPDKFDLYAGANLGYYTWTSPKGYPGSHASGLGFGAQVGGRWFFTNKVGLNLEFGGGNAFSGGKFGLTIKL